MIAVIESSSRPKGSFSDPWLCKVLIAGAICCSSLLGCGEKSASLHGKVTLDGAPIKTGAMYIANTNPKVAPPVNADIVNGEYRISGLVAGDYGVSPNAFKETGKTIEVHDVQSKEYVNIVPPKYAAGEIIKIHSGDNTYDLNMVSK